MFNIIIIILYFILLVLLFFIIIIFLYYYLIWYYHFKCISFKYMLNYLFFFLYILVPHRTIVIGEIKIFNFLVYKQVLRPQEAKKLVFKKSLYVCRYVCMYVYMFVRMYVRM